MPPQLCTPQPTFVVIEQIYSKRGLPSIPATGGILSPSLFQVLRRVLQVCDVQDIFFEGRHLSGPPSLWQYVQEFFKPGQQITTRPTGQREIIMMYAGFRNILQPLPKVDNLLPASWTRRYDLGTPPSPFIYGTDPIPRVQLYGNPRAEFIMPGGQPPATAVGIYHQGKNQLELPPRAQREKMIQQLVQPNQSRR